MINNYLFPKKIKIKSDNIKSRKISCLSKRRQKKKKNHRLGFFNNIVYIYISYC